MVRRVCRELGNKRNILVINDEAHHCYRRKPKARSDGIPVKLEVWPGMVHVFQIRRLPESREAIEHIADFIRSRLPASP